MMRPPPLWAEPVTAADIVADAVAKSLGDIPDVADFFEILPRWDDAPRTGPFCAVTAADGQGVLGEDGALFAPVVEIEVALCASQGEGMDIHGWPAARRALAAFFADGLRQAIRREIPDADSVVEWLGEEAAADGARFASSFRARITFSNNIHPQGGF